MEIASFIISIISALASAVTIVVTWVLYCETVKHDKKVDTLDAFNRLQNEALDHLYKLSAADIKRISQNPRSDEYKQITVYLARIEHFCVGVNTGIYSVEVVKRMAGKYLVATYKKCYPLIEKKRAISQADKHNDEFEKTVGKINDEYHRK